MAGFFRLLPSLSPQQKAAAVHLGIFPNASEIRVASVSPGISTTQPALGRTGAVSQGPQRAQAAPQLAPSPSFSTPPRIAVADPLPRASQSTPLASPLAASAIAPAATEAQGRATPMPADRKVGLASVREPTAPRSTETAPPTSVALSSSPSPAATHVPTSTSEPAIVPINGDRLLGIDRLLAQADELPVPPAPRPLFEKPKAAAVETAKVKKPEGQTAEEKKAEAKKAEAKKADAKKADAKKADAKKADEAKKAADAKADREAIGIAGTNWVQLAGGSNADRMGAEFRRLASQSAALKKRGGAVTAGKDYFRLLAGPFPTRDAAQAFVNQLAKDGVDGFSWTRTPATLKIEKLPPK